MLLSLIAFFCAVAVQSLAIEPLINIPLKPLKTSADRIREHGYPAESHFVETSDHYVLNLFRIPYSPKLNNKDAEKPVVFIQHGLFSCSDCFLLNGPDNALAFNFADAGYDVWLGNARGNIYSRNNTVISLNHPDFWTFSWDSIGTIDMPESIDYVLAHTGQTKLHYVGHSQGTTVFFVMTSALPAYNEKIKTAHMLAPPIFMGNVTDGLVVALAPTVGVPGSVGATLMGNQQFIPENRFVQRALDTACGGISRFPKYCRTLFLLWAGTDQINLNATLLPYLAETHPAGISTNQGMHFMQSYLTNKFSFYDFGAKKNMRHYNQEVPPEFPLELITSDMYIYYGLSDGSATALDCQRLPEYLPNIKLFREIEDPTWGHLDFIFALQVKEVINDPVIEACDKYEIENAYKS